MQLSDIHVSKFAHHDIVPDLLELGDAVLAGIKPQAVLITGARPGHARPSLLPANQL